MDYKAVVVYDWDAVDPTEMSIKQGDVLLVRSVNDRGWALAEKDGQSGWVPNDYLTPQEEQPASSASPAVETTSSEQAEIEDALKKINLATQALDNTPTATVSSTPADSTDVCFRCSKSLTGCTSVVAKGRNFHQDCFTCSSCDCSLVGVGFMEKEGKYFCEKDYYKAHGHVCFHCNEVIVGSHIMGNNHVYHLDHLLCSVCTKSIGTDVLHVKDDKPVCHDCYNTKYACKCYKCDKPIEYQVFTALDRSYHRECFVCEVGGHTMPDESFHLHEDKVYCPEHFKKLFAKTCAGCKKEIEGQYLQVLTDYFHSDCWRCTACSCLLNESGCARKFDQFYCPKCVVNATAPAPAKTAPSVSTSVANAEANSSPRSGDSTPSNVDAAVMRERLMSLSAQAEAAAKDLKERPAVEILPEKEFYTHAELIDHQALPPSVVRSAKEKYLSDSDFENIFKMSRSEFDALKLWRQHELKKAAQIF